MKMVFVRLALKARRLRMWLVAKLVFRIQDLLASLPMESALNLADRAGRRLGPLTARHKLALANLKNAFPEKTDDEREAIARDMWSSMFRLGSEYIFLDQMIDWDAEHRDEPSRVEVSGREIFLDLLEKPRPFIVFTAHTGSFELLPVIAARYGLNVTALFRPPNNPYIARRLLAARETSHGNLVPSRAGAAWDLAKVLENGGGVGLLVDQKFGKGVKTTFFGQPVHTNPLLAKLVRQYECEVFPARSIRLPGGRVRLEMEPAIEIPRTDTGSVDVAATAQLLNSKVESWVREYPGQWQWFHDRWDIKHTLKS